MEITDLLENIDKKGWRKWLSLNHDSKKEIWVEFYKKHTGKVNMLMDEAVDEAICFGWIDSIMRKIDDDRYTIRFTPRKKNSGWSERNKIRAIQLIEEGKMTKGGFEKINWLNTED